MAIAQFPPLHYANPEGLLAVGGDLEVASLKLAYSNGIFPWPTEEEDLLPWFAPPERMVLKFEDFKIPRRLRQELKKKNFRFAVDQSFGAVIRACAAGETRSARGTWISPAIVSAYEDFHRAGYAHSFECYNQERLVGGMYGVSLGAMFAGESMFFLESGASKAALIFAVEYLQERGARWFDAQMPSPLLESFGARLVPRDEFTDLLRSALAAPPIFALTPPSPRD